MSFDKKLNSSGRTRRFAAVTWMPLLVLIAPAVVACTDATDQSAVQPGQVLIVRTPTVDASNAFTGPYGFGSPAASPTVPLSILPTILSTDVHAAPSRVFFTQGGDLWQIPFASGNASSVVTDKSILAFAPSGDGEQVAVVYLAPETGEEHLADLKPDGTPIIDITLPIPPDDGSQHGGEIQSIAWSPSGDHVAVARQDGSISVVGTDGQITQIVDPDRHRFPGGLDVSPHGQTLLFLDPDLPGRATSLFVVPMNGGASRKLVDGTVMTAPVLNARWLPEGNLIAYLQPTSSSPEYTGDLFAIDAQSRSSKLVVASTEFAPVAGIGDFAFSPDDRWVAFTLYVPHEDGSRFRGLWLKNLSTGDTEKVATKSDEAVTDLWWSDETLLFRTVSSDDLTRPAYYTGIEPFSLYSMSPKGKPELRYTSP